MPNNPGVEGLREGLQGPLKTADSPNQYGTTGQPKQPCSGSNKPRRTRKPSVARVIQQMKRAGVEIAGCEINPRDGTVRVIAGRPVDGGNIDIDEASIDRSEWG